MSKFGVGTEEAKETKPHPEIFPFNAPFWEGTRNHELRIQECQACSHRQFPPKSSCEECMKRDFNWVKCSGKGKVYSFAMISQVVMNSLAFQREIPYVLASIDLEEGVRIISQVVDSNPDQAKIGMDVEVFFEDIGDNVSITKFRPSR
jgi:uncharacterized OB-fold protein